MTPMADYNEIRFEQEIAEHLRCSRLVVLAERRRLRPGASAVPERRLRVVGRHPAR